MAGNGGYNHYRGRRSRGKALLAVLLVLVILAAIVVILLQRHIVYDETGTPQLEMFWKNTEETESVLALDLVIEAFVQPELHSFQLAPGPLTRERWESALAEADPVYDAVTVVWKDEDGTVYHDAASAEDMKSVLAECELRTVAEINCFHDPQAASADPEDMGLMDTRGYLFYDGGNHQWLDPAKPAVCQYLRELAVEAAQMGFDEILLTHFAYPTDGQLEQVVYGDVEKSENLRLLLEELRAALEPYGVLLSVEVSADVITTGENEVSGQKLTEIAASADRIFAAASVEEAGIFAAQLRSAAGEECTFAAVAEAYDPALTGSFLIVE